MRWGIIAVTVLWGGVGFAEERVADAQKEADPVQGKIEATAFRNDEFVPASPSRNTTKAISTRTVCGVMAMTFQK